MIGTRDRSSATFRARRFISGRGEATGAIKKQLEEIRLLRIANGGAMDSKIGRGKFGMSRSQPARNYFASLAMT